MGFCMQLYLAFAVVTSTPGLVADTSTIVQPSTNLAPDLLKTAFANETVHIQPYI
eukprot:m.42432 g.42432  ORF g.42432 m.42432 type:complete len:55 (-) comp12879_c0_seq1:1353-1517(-)